jgi:hypothetical protein
MLGNEIAFNACDYSFAFAALHNVNRNIQLFHLIINLIL